MIQDSMVAAPAGWEKLVAGWLGCSWIPHFLPACSVWRVSDHPTLLFPLGCFSMTFAGFYGFSGPHCEQPPLANPLHLPLLVFPRAAAAS